MKTSSAKGKGRRLQQQTAQMIQLALEQYKDIFLEYGPDGDIGSREMGQKGCDIKLSPKGKEIVPFSIECKNTERIDIWGSWKQCNDNTQEGRIPLLVFKRNRSEVLACLPLEDLLKLTYKK